MKARLVYQRDGREQVRSIETQLFTIGRSSGCDVVVDVPGISGEHCRLRLRDGAWWAEDPGSTNGLAVDGNLLAPKQPVRIGHSARLVFGDDQQPLFEARFEVVEAAVAPSRKPPPVTESAPAPPADDKAKRQRDREVADLRKELAGLRAELTQRETTAGDDVRNAERALAIAEEKLRTTRADLAELKTVHGGLRDDLTAAREKIVQLEARLDVQRLDAKRAYEEIDQHHRKAVKELARMTAELEVARRELKTASEGLEDCRKENERLVAQLILD